MPRRFLCFLFVFCLCWAAAAVSGGPARSTNRDLEMIALSGLSYPEPRGRVVAERFLGTPVIDDLGTIAFLGMPATSYTASQLFVHRGGTTSASLVAGEPVTGVLAASSDRAVFGSFSDVHVTDVAGAGSQIRFRGTWLDNDGQRSGEGLWSLRQLHHGEPLALSGDLVPGHNNELRFASFGSSLALDNHGNPLFFARTKSKEAESQLGSGLWHGSRDMRSEVAIGGGDAGLEAGTTFLPQSFETPFSESPIVSAGGTAYFRAFLAGPGVDTNNLTGLWQASAGGPPSLLVRSGDATPGIPGSEFRGFPSVPAVNEAEQVAFLAFYGADEHDHLHDEHNDSPQLGLWLRQPNGEFRLLTQQGAVAPPLAQGAIFVDFFDPVIGHRGEVAFLSVLAGNNTSAQNELAMWISTNSEPDGLRLVARQGESAPEVGLADEFRFGHFFAPSLNRSGQIAFPATAFSGDGSTDEDRFEGIWGEDRAGNLRMVAGTGQRVEVAPADIRTIASLGFTSETGGEDGRARGLNDAGLLALRIDFTDGSSGIFLSRTLTVPEPRSADLAIIFVFASVATVRRRITRSLN